MKQKILLIASGIFGLAMASQGALVAHYAFDETSGNTAFDSSGNGHHANISNTGTGSVTLGVTNSVSGTAFQFAKGSTNNTGGFVTAGNIFSSVTNQLSISVWFNAGLANNTINRNTIVSASDIASGVANRYTDIGYLGDSNDNRNADNVGKVSTRHRPHNSAAVSPNANILSGAAVAVDEWQHVVLTLDLSTPNTAVLSHYLNGVLVSANTLTGGEATNSFDLYDTLDIGRLARGNSNVDYFSGLIDDVQVYDHTLTSSEVTYLFNNAGQAIPEPSALGLAGLGFLALLRRKRA